MLDRLKKWMKGVGRRMLGGVKRDGRIGLGLGGAADPMREAIDLWMRMYKGCPPWRCDEVKTLSLPSLIAAEVARMATIEMQSVVSGEGPRAGLLDAAYAPVIRDIRRITEYSGAGGSIALKPYVAQGKLAVDYVMAGRYVPIQYDASGNVDGCIFIDTLTEGTTVYTRVEEHTMEPDGVRIINKAYRARAGTDDLGEEIPLTRVDDWAELAPDYLHKGITTPLFSILRMPFANNIDTDSPLGISVYARAVQLIEEADRQYSRLLWEMESGNRALYVDLRALESGDADATRLAIKRLYRTMDGGPTGADLYHEWSPALREQNQINALNELLQRIEDACGISRGTLSAAPESSAGGAKTATELKIMRQRTFATVCDTQKAVESALRGLLQAMDAWITIASLAPAGAYSVTFAFDDSVVTDRAAEFMERSQLVTMGAMDAWELRAWYLGEPEEEARAKAQKRERRMQAFGIEE